MPRLHVVAASVLAVLAITSSSVAGDAARTRAGQSAGVTWLVFVDDLHLSFRETGRIRGVLKTSLDTLVRDGDRVLLQTDGPSQLRLHLPAVDRHFDRERLREAMKRLTGNGLKPEDIARGRREPRYRAAVAVDALRELVDAALPIRGPVAILCISNGYTDEGPLIGDIAEQASRAGAAIFPIDPRLEPSDREDPHWIATRDSLRELATATAGTWQDIGEDLETYLMRISAAVRPWDVARYASVPLSSRAGSIRSARRAGSQTAVAPTMATIATGRTNAVQPGESKMPPRPWARRVIANVADTPPARPAATTRTEAHETSHSTCARVAPMAIRTASSVPRRETAKASTP
jgi:hypothetical protein